MSSSAEVWHQRCSLEASSIHMIQVTTTPVTSSHLHRTGLSSSIASSKRPNLGSLPKGTHGHTRTYSRLHIHGYNDTDSGRNARVCSTVWVSSASSIRSKLVSLCGHWWRSPHGKCRLSPTPIVTMVTDEGMEKRNWGSRVSVPTCLPHQALLQSPSRRVVLNDDRSLPCQM